MNYKSQLKGWAVDRVIEFCKATESNVLFEEVMTKADELAAYAYVAEEDFQTTAKSLIELAPEATVEQLEHLIAALQMVQEQSQARETKQ